MTVVGAALLLAIGRALARIHIEHYHSWRSPSVHAVDPLPGQISKRREVLRTSEPFRLETPHLARGCRSIMNRSIANDPPHRRVTTQALGVVHVLVARELPEHRLPQQADQCVPTVLARARIREHLARPHGQPQRVVQLAIRQQSGIGRDHSAAKSQHQTAVEIESQRPASRFTRRVHDDRLTRPKIRY